VEGTEDPPLAELLADVGLRLHMRAAEGARDRGGQPGKPHANGQRASLGVKLASGEAKLVYAFRDGAAARAGLAAGDVVIAANDLKVTAESLDAAVARARPGDRLTLHAFRRDELMRFDVTLEEAPHDTCYLALDAAAPEAAQARRRAWLGA
jgi:predicted metalloprotease with PDZ domain